MQFTGIIPPLVTPFDADGVIRFDALASEVHYLLDRGVHGLSLGGSTGEGALLSDQELVDGIELLKQENDRDVPIVCGIIRNSAADAIRAGKRVADAGADAVMVTPTYYHGTDDDGNFTYYQMISEQVGLPIIIYNVIDRNPIRPNLMLRLCDIPNIIGIKQSYGGLDGFNAMHSTCAGKTMVYGAQDDALYGDYILGADGAISAILAVFPELCVEQWDAVQEGDLGRARDIHALLFPIWQIIKESGMSFPGRIKALLKLLGRDGGLPRAPIFEPTQSVVKRLRDSLDQAGLLPVSMNV
ncbi:MAG: dihydrodipicolinate synthase family protein [Phycisphaeraceae bacterium JB051]